MIPSETPPPLEWHPAYQGNAFVAGWLNGNGQFAHLDLLRVPIPQPLRLLFTQATAADPSAIMRAHQLQRVDAWGGAPYVGRPFVYVWPVACDELGRCIAGEARIVYLGDTGRP